MTEPLMIHADIHPDALATPFQGQYKPIARPFKLTLSRLRLLPEFSAVMSAATLLFLSAR